MPTLNIILTGAGRGLGRHLALHLACRPDVGSLSLLSRDEARLHRVADEIVRTAAGNSGSSPRVEVLTGDLSSIVGIERVVRHLGELNIAHNVLINNAGGATVGALDNLSPREIEAMLNLNLLAPILLSRYLVARARPSGWGRIINVSSISAVLKPHPVIIPYITAKNALLKLSECVAAAEEPNGITCNAILPGLMLTDMGREAIKVSFPDYNEQNAAEIEARIASGFPEKRLVSPDDIAGRLDSLLSRDADSITGEFFRVASGL